MKPTNSQSGFTPIHLLLLLVIFGIIGFAGWKVYDASKTVNQPKAATAPAPAAQKAESKVPDGFVEFKNEELGFKFAYPKEWGNIEIDKSDNTTSGRLGQLYYGEFSIKKNVKLIYNTADYDAFPGGGCALSRRVIVKSIDPAEIMENSKIVKTVNTDARLTNSQYYTDSTVNDECVSDGDYDTATFNINNQNYKAVQLRYEYAKDRENLAHDVFLKVVKTIEIL